MDKKTAPVRVRIAPSPTGDPHVGLAYATLFNYAFAKKHHGKLVLRIEDTDQTRAKPESDSLIMESLKWLGLQWDEGPDIKGPFAPYRQSERTSIYQEHVLMLLNSGHAYRCFCSAERLHEMREKQRALGENTGYDGFCRSLTEETNKQYLEDHMPYVVRLKIPHESESVVFIDEIRGPIEIMNKQLDDQVLMKTDGFPTYHLANVVDDHLMQITHVIRAEEWISSTPKHVHLYHAFGWQLPQFIHLPILRNTNRSKISKRKNPVSLNYFKRKGILPRAMLNFLALMGFSLGDDKEFFTLEEFCEGFDVKKISPNGPVFDMVKLGSINQKYISELSENEFVAELTKNVFDPAYLRKLVPLYQNRITAFEEFIEKASFFFTGSFKDALELPQGVTKEELKPVMAVLLERLDDLYEWTEANIQAMMDSHVKECGFKSKNYFMSLRMIVTGRKDSPPLAQSMQVLGREMTRARIRDFLTN